MTMVHFQALVTVHSTFHLTGMSTYAAQPLLFTSPDTGDRGSVAAHKAAPSIQVHHCCFPEIKHLRINLNNNQNSLNCGLRPQPATSHLALLGQTCGMNLRRAEEATREMQTRYKHYWGDNLQKWAGTDRKAKIFAPVWCYAAED